MIDDMAVYIANLGKYNEGYLVGAWFTFPIDEEDVKEKIGLNEQYEEYAIHDTDNFPIAIGEYVSIEELNEMYEMICRHRPLMRCIPQRKRQSPACPTSSVAWCRNSSPDRRDDWKSRNSIGRISLTSVWSFKRHKKQGRHSERLTDQRQRELPVPMSDQPQLQRK